MLIVVLMLVYVVLHWPIHLSQHEMPLIPEWTMVVDVQLVQIVMVHKSMAEHQMVHTQIAVQIRIHFPKSAEGLHHAILCCVC